jgi:ribosomal protein S10
MLYIKGVIIVGRVAGTYEWQIAIYKRFIKVFIQHLHQLQNLMYMLTGEELTINIPQLT